jgi:hypothetical protein
VKTVFWLGDHLETIFVAVIAQYYLTINRIIEKRLEAFEMWVYRRMTRTSWKDMVTNERLSKK